VATTPTQLMTAAVSQLVREGDALVEALIRHVLLPRRVRKRAVLQQFGAEKGETEGESGERAKMRC
jgi:hypothetical protein